MITPLYSCYGFPFYWIRIQTRNHNKAENLTPTRIKGRNHSTSITYMTFPESRAFLKLAGNSNRFSGGHNRGAGLERVQPHHGQVLPAGREEAEGAEARPRPETQAQVRQTCFGQLKYFQVSLVIGSKFHLLRILYPPFCINFL